MIKQISDLLARQQALDPTHSYIVQAPAGSGKTELLIQRFLTLLTCVEEPESIVALTFTQKAAAEMRERILGALEKTANNQKNSQPETDKLAKIVLNKNEKFQWNLLHSPHRLRIQTIDSLCAELVSKMPLLSKGIPYSSIEKDPASFYQEAAQRCLTEGIQDSAYQHSVETLLLHLGNHYTHCISLLSNMLNWREQWLPLIGYTQTFSSTHIRSILERSLKNLHQDATLQLEHIFSEEIKKELRALCDYSETMLSSSGEYSFWEKVTSLLLTKDNLWRSAVDKRLGFPSSSESKNKEEQAYLKTMKERMQHILSYWRENETQSEPARLVLENYRKLPPATYSESQWSILEALITLLPFLAAQLKVVFMESGKIDFAEVSEQASEALGSTEEPTDLALYCDYVIKHFLIDEFQDTSFKQFRLLEKLTQGWETGDGRTLFIVGDPMQSIYRFREANVSLFLEARNSGIGAISLKSLILTSNFRSHIKLIEWVNQCFHTIFPAQDDIQLGAIKHNASTPGRPDYDNEGNIYFYQNPTVEEQGKHIVDIIKNIPAEKTIGLLIHSRNQLKAILPYLQQENIAFQGIDIDSLATRPYIQDLYALTQTILQPTNQLAWHTTLRAPWCGLTLADLWALTQNSPDFSLSSDGKQRVEKVQTIIIDARQQRQKIPLSLLVEQTWRKLEGHIYTDAKIQKDMETFWSLLDTIPYEQYNLMDELLQKISKLYSNTSEESNLHIMTIHKSKGLEFDHIILPDLEASLSKTTLSLLQHMERRTLQGESNFLLAPIKSIENPEDPAYQYLHYIDKKKELFEKQRLLYVALTRARSNIHLFTVLPEKSAPVKNSFLDALMPHLSEQMYQPPLNYSETAPALAKNPARILRLSSEHFRSLPKTLHTQTTNKKLTPREQNTLIQVAGIFIHEQIQQCADAQLSAPPTIQLNDAITYRLMELGLYTQIEQTEVIQYTQQALNNLYQDEIGQWILNPLHSEQKNEHEINYFDQESQSFSKAILDRTFVDLSTKTRWIIDYKITQDALPSGTHSVALAPEQYRKQLEQYGQLLNQHSTNIIKLGLYYPLTKTWIQWPLKKTCNSD